MMQRTGRGSAAEPRHRQRIGHELGRHARLDKPAHHLPVEQVQRDRQVEPAFVSPDVRYVRGEQKLAR